MQLKFGFLLGGDMLVGNIHCRNSNLIVIEVAPQKILYSDERAFRDFIWKMFWDVVPDYAKKSSCNHEGLLEIELDDMGFAQWWEQHSIG